MAATPVAVFLLPPIDALRGVRAPSLELLHARGDASPAREPGLFPALSGLVDAHPWPPAIAALTRAVDAPNDAAGAWLRADPCYLQPDHAGVRLFGFGTLALTAAEAAELARALRPLFGDDGFELSLPHPDRWYLRLPTGAKLPRFAHPGDALGADLHDHLPEGELGKRWRRLLGEAQVILHNHPVNAERAARGALPANSVWFWGGGARPDWVRTAATLVASDDPSLHGLATIAGTTSRLLDPALAVADGQGLRLLDLRGEADVATLERDWLAPAVAHLRAGGIASLELRSVDGTTRTATRGALRRFWRRVKPL
ncbi:MAG TPA: phosphoglycerate mutase [Xanthomonadales bacterium]|nr:phosphoglycerate mutase [Xanthomonadales bacterium]